MLRSGTRPSKQRYRNSRKSSTFKKPITGSGYISNVAMVRKATGKWHMCVDFTNLNKSCPKDGFPLPCIDQLLVATIGHNELLSFVDAYSGYNQIMMHPEDHEANSFL